MATYLVLNTMVLAAIVLGLYAWKALRFDRILVVVTIVLVVMTAVFDSIMIHFGFFAYNETLILGWFVGKAPIEDFLYAVMAGILVPMVWNKLGRDHGKNTTTH